MPEKLAERLKPCPFCGGETKVFFLVGVPEYESWGVKCKECGSSISGFGAREEAAAAWFMFYKLEKAKTAM